MDAAKVELLRSLGKVARGLSTLFWSLPLALLIDVESARTEWLGFLNDAAILPGLAAGAALYYGLRQMRDFQKQERIWQRALTRAEFLAIINTGLAPFLFWWHRFPNIGFYSASVLLLTFCGLLFLVQVNQVLRRLCAMLPDEALREESRIFSALNVALLAIALLGFALAVGLDEARIAPIFLTEIMAGESPRGLWLTLFVCLMPLALTLAMVWKIKEVIYNGIFTAER